MVQHSVQPTPGAKKGGGALSAVGFKPRTLSAARPPGETAFPRGPATRPSGDVEPGPDTPGEGLIWGQRRTHGGRRVTSTETRQVTGSPSGEASLDTVARKGHGEQRGWGGLLSPGREGGEAGAGQTGPGRAFGEEASQGQIHS